MEKGQKKRPPGALLDEEFRGLVCKALRLLKPPGAKQSGAGRTRSLSGCLLLTFVELILDTVNECLIGGINNIFRNANGPPATLLIP